MTKAKTLDRLELTRRSMAAREALRHGHGIIAEVEDDEEEYADENLCPYCGIELVRYESCCRCRKCGWSKCG